MYQAIGLPASLHNETDVNGSPVCFLPCFFCHILPVKFYYYFSFSYQLVIIFRSCLFYYYFVYCQIYFFHIFLFTILFIVYSFVIKWQLKILPMCIVPILGNNFHFLFPLFGLLTSQLKRLRV